MMSFNLDISYFFPDDLFIRESGTLRSIIVELESIYVFDSSSVFLTGHTRFWFIYV